jgi:hypothetical protein
VSAEGLTLRGSEEAIVQYSRTGKEWQGAEADKQDTVRIVVHS